MASVGAKQKLFGKDCRSLQVHSRLQCVEIISLRIDFLGGWEAVEKWVGDCRRDGRQPLFALSQQCVLLIDSAGYLQGFP